VRTVQGSNDTLNWILSDHLGSASVTANADGTWNSEIKYRGAPPQGAFPVGGTAFGEVRASYGLTPTDYRYTGQLEQAELGLYYYVARWYDPYITQFTQPDSIDPYNPLDWNRYAYVRYNAVNYTDPTGHIACWDENAGQKGCNQVIYQYKLNYWDPLPTVEDIPNLENRPSGVIQRTVDNYEKVRANLYYKYGSLAVDSKGKIKDQFLIAGFIFAELPVQGSGGYNEALEAVSNQYDDGDNPLYPNQMLCEGNCNLEEQIAWMSDLEGFYNGKLATDLAAGSVDLTVYLEDAGKAMNNFYVGVDASWMWGDVTNEELEIAPWKNHIYFKGKSDYPGKDWWVVH